MESELKQLNDVILGMIDDFTDSLTNNSKQHFNERYLHHRFSHEIQSMTGPITFTSQKNSLHPEWATYAKCRNDKNPDNPGAKYKNCDKKNCYITDDENGASGYVDFTIGSLDKPEIGIEFKLGESLTKKGIEFDYTKLMDVRNPFKTSISVIIYYGHKRKSELFDKQMDYYYNAKQKLVNRFCHNRALYFFFVDIYGTEVRRKLLTTDTKFNCDKNNMKVITISNSK